MFKHFVRKRKTAAGFASALLVATAFQPAGCNVTLDPEMLSSLTSAVQDFAGSFGSTGDWFSGGPPFGHSNHDDCDDVDDGAGETEVEDGGES